MGVDEEIRIEQDHRKVSPSAVRDTQWFARKMEPGDRFRNVDKCRALPMF